MKKFVLAALLLALSVRAAFAGEIPIGPAPPPPACTENCTRSATQPPSLIPLIVIELLIKLRS